MLVAWTFNESNQIQRSPFEGVECTRLPSSSRVQVVSRFFLLPNRIRVRCEVYLGHYPGNAVPAGRHSRSRLRYTIRRPLSSMLHRSYTQTRKFRVRAATAAAAELFGIPGHRRGCRRARNVTFSVRVGGYLVAYDS